MFIFAIIQALTIVLLNLLQLIEKMHPFYVVEGLWGVAVVLVINVHFSLLEMSYLLVLQHLPGQSLFLLLLGLKVLLIRLIVKHYKRLFLWRISHDDGLLVLVERHLTYDLVELNGGLFIFVLFILLGLLSLFRILFVEMLFRVFLTLRHSHT